MSDHEDRDNRTRAIVNRLEEIEEELTAWLGEVPATARPHLRLALVGMQLAIANSRHPGLYCVSLEQAVTAGIPAVVGGQVGS